MGGHKKKRVRLKYSPDDLLYQQMQEAYDKWKGSSDWMQRLEKLVVQWNTEFGTRKDPRKELAVFLHEAADQQRR